MVRTPTTMKNDAHTIQIISMVGRWNIVSFFYYNPWWDAFFHGDRLDETVCRLAGWMRVAFAALVCSVC
jgi:hypothetical protein